MKKRYRYVTIRLKNGEEHLYEIYSTSRADAIKEATHLYLNVYQDVEENIAEIICATQLN